MNRHLPILARYVCILLLLGSSQHVMAQTRSGPPFTIDRYWRGVSRWYAEIGYGSGTIDHLSSISPFASPGLLELRIGARDLRLVRRGVLDSEEKYGMVKWYSRDFSAFKNTSQPVRLSTVGFGLGSRTAYGYQWGAALLFPYHEYAITFTKIQPAYPSSILDADRALIDRFKGPFRLGISLEGGFRLHVSRVLSFQAGVEGTAVYPRLIFPEWSASFMATVAGFMIAGRAAESVLASSPLVAPIFHFLVKNSLSFLLYRALRKNSHWPFPSEPPLTGATLKAGFAIAF